MTHRSIPAILALAASACLPDAQSDACEPPVEQISWASPLRSNAITLLGEAAHSGVDVLAEPGEVTVLEAKFAYGATSADLEGESVAVFVEGGECEWIDAGEHTTDSDGRVHAEFNTAGLADGVHRVRFVVRADLSETESKLHIVAASTPIVVFDIDGTLTTSDVELVDGIVLHHVGSASDEVYDLAGSPLTRAQWLGALDVLLDEEAETYEGAVDVVRYYEERGVQPVYITGRPYLYDGLTRRWFEEQGLPPGPLFMAPSLREALPSGVAEFKRRTLGELQARGHSIVAAYGNAKTDVCAYEAAGVPSEVTYIVGPRAGEGCASGTNTPTVPLLSYVEHRLSLSE